MISVSVTTTTSSVSNYDYEVNENENKRSIHILKNDYVGQIQGELEKALSR
jgi:DMSO/TMAO reductase YedYZ molybdopterin-dependent catalytic subunit